MSTLSMHVRVSGVLLSVVIAIAIPLAQASPAVRAASTEVQYATPSVPGPEGGAPLRHVPLPAGTRIVRHYYDPQTGELRGAGADETDEPILVYSNIGGEILAAPGSNRLIADDVEAIAVGGCQMPEAHVSAYEVLVGVCDSSGGGDPYIVEFGIYDACPGAEPPGLLVPGTEGSVSLEDDGLLHLITVDLEGYEVSLGSDFWVGVQFSGNPNAGWVAGAPADLGYTHNVFDYPHPALRCTACFGGTDLWAGFYIRVYCRGDFDRQFPAYINPNLDASVFTPGAWDWVADDVELVAPDCVLTQFDVGVVGQDGPFELQMELWKYCGPEFVIEGSQRTYDGCGNGFPEIASFDFPEGLDLGGAPYLWFALRVDNHYSGPIIAGEPVLGYSADLFAMLDGAECEYFWFGGVYYAAFNATFHCMDAGACCDLSAPAGSLCRQTTEAHCQGPMERWADGAFCWDPNAFDPPCGTAACCWWDASCQDVVEGHCASHEGAWYAGALCSDPDMYCSHACEGALGSCFAPHATAGCSDQSCCEGVCAWDPFCCLDEWDAECALLAWGMCSWSSQMP